MYKNINKKMSDSVENILINVVRDSNSYMDKINNSVLSNNKLIQTLIEKVNKSEEENKYLRENADVTQKLVHELLGTVKVLYEKIEVLEKPKQKRQVREKKPEEPKIQCTCHTKKGEQCKKWCLPGHDTCKQHAKTLGSTVPDEPGGGGSGGEGRKEEPSSIPTKRKRGTGTEKPVTKKMPMHNHDPGETPSEPCYVCLAHGDVLDPDMPDDEYVGTVIDGLTLEERLRRAIEEDEKSDPGSEYEYIEEEIEVEVEVDENEDGNEIIHNINKNKNKNV